MGAVVGRSARVLAADDATEGAGAGLSGRGGKWAIAGLSMGVLVDDGPLSKVRLASGADGDGTSADVSGDSQARFLPFLRFSCAMRYSKIVSAGNARRSALPVTGLIGIRVHRTFLALHRAQGPRGFTSHFMFASMHSSHCHHLLALSRLRRGNIPETGTVLLDPAQYCSRQALLDLARYRSHRTLRDPARYCSHLSALRPGPGAGSTCCGALQ
jgi:hypothetical protein